MSLRIHLVDLDGAKDGKLVNDSVFKDIRAAVSCELELGGGIRTIDAATNLFNLGFDYLVLGSLLTKDFQTATDIISAFPNQIIAGIDLKDGAVAVEGWLESSAISLSNLLSKLENLPVSSVICTNISKDGMLQGPDTEGLISLSSQTTLPIIASGGVSCIQDIHTLQKYYKSGIIGCIVGKALLSQSLDLNAVFVTKC